MPRDCLGAVSPAPDRSLARFLLIGIGAAIVAVLTWGLYTQHAWEDFYISYRASRNLALGHGLVFQPGEKLHTFTSPLHTLLLAGLAAIDGAREDPVRVLWLYRLIGAVALGSALGLVLDLGRRQGSSFVAAAVAAGLVLCDPKTLDFTVAGMEAPLMIFFLALQLHALLAGDGWRRLGVAWAGLMWTRPDAFILVLASLAAVLIFGVTDRKPLLRRAAAAAALAAALYAPWLIAATLYYGSPIPHTVVAKGLGHASAGDWLRAIVRAPWEMLAHGSVLPRIYGASYVRFASDWGATWLIVWRVLATVAWLYWLNPRGGRLGRIASLAFFLATLYAASAPFYPWYAPSYALLASLAWGGIVGDFAVWLRRDEFSRLGRIGVAAPLALAAALLVTQGASAAMISRTMRWHQQLDETGNRRVIGEWLRAHARAGDTVFLECVGYIGYYSGLKTHDFPGLTSREMVAARRRLRTDDYGALIAALQPDWLVLRPWERDNVRRSQPGLLATDAAPAAAYELILTFDRSADVAALGALPGRRYLQTDQTFEVYRRRAPQRATTP